MLSKTKAIKEAYAKLFHQSFCSRSFFRAAHLCVETPINAGCAVRVALGSREIIGITEGKTEKPETLKIIKPILSIIDEHSIISEEQQALVQFASDYYKAPLGDFYYPVSQLRFEREDHCPEQRQNRGSHDLALIK